MRQDETNLTLFTIFSRFFSATRMIRENQVNSWEIRFDWLLKLKEREYVKAAYFLKRKCLR